MASFFGLWLAVFLALYVVFYRPWLNRKGSRVTSRWNQRSSHYKIFSRILYERLKQTVSGFSNKEMNVLIAELNSVDGGDIMDSSKNINDFYKHTTQLWKLGILPIRYEQEEDVDDDETKPGSDTQ
ncbi:MAG: hypothetical protein ACYC2K_19070 [Gemmatimonadales bacterium]